VLLLFPLFLHSPLNKIPLIHHFLSSRLSVSFINTTCQELVAFFSCSASKIFSSVFMTYKST
jgi:hypothetical protein